MLERKNNIMSATIRTIVLKGIGHHDEGVLDAIAYPGQAIRLAADGHYDPETLSAANAICKGLMLLKEDALQGKVVTEAYGADDVGFIYTPVAGDEVQVLVAEGEDVNLGDTLGVIGSGDGNFQVISSASVEEYKVPLASAKVHDALATNLPATLADTNEEVRLPLTSAKTWDALATPLPAAQSADDMAIITGTPGTDAPTLQADDPGGTTSTAYAAFEFVIPQSYRSGGAVTVRAKAGVLTTVSDTTLTLDCSCWKDAGTGLVGEDLCTTTLQSINSLTPANMDFIITPTGFVAGDRLIIQFVIAGEDSGNAGTITPEISNVSVLVASGLGGADDLALITGTPGTDALTIQGSDFGGTTSAEKAAFEFVIPQSYRSGGAITVRAKAGVLTTISDNTLTLDVECWKDAGTGLVGEDLCTTVAQDINSLTAANKDFTITPTGVVAGDRLIVRLSVAGDDSGNAGVMIPEISNVAVLIADFAGGQLEAKEDSGGALTADTLLHVRVL